MLLRLDGTDDRPIYAQIADQIRAAVGNGVLRPGQLVPSVRDVSKQLLVNPNTVARAYRELQSESVLEPVRGTGLQVTAAAPAVCRDERLGHVRQRLRLAVQEAIRSRMSIDEVEAMLREEWLGGAGSGNGQAH